MGGEQPQRQRVVVLLIHLLKEAQKRRATGILTCRGPLDAAKDSLPHSEAALSKLDKWWLVGYNVPDFPEAQGLIVINDCHQAVTARSESTVLFYFL